MRKKLYCLALSLLLLLPFATSCKKGTPPPEDSGTTPPATSEELPVPVQELDQDFTILVGSDTVNEYGMNTFTTEDTGTKLNAAIVARNRLIEERLKVTIKSETIDCYEARDLVDRICQTGVFTYDAFAMNMNLGVPLSVKGLFLSSSDMEPTLDLSASWWDETALNCLRINNRIYPLIGRGVLHYYESALFMAYNKDYANQLGMPNFAELALDGEWTYEAFLQYSKAAYLDADSDEKKSEGDIFGYSGAIGLAVNALYASGETLLTYDEQNYPSFSGFNSRTVNISDYISQNFYNSDAIYLAPRDNVIRADKGANNAWHNVFRDGYSLFYSDCVGSLQKMRDASFEFTVLPYPKYEKDDKYVTVIAAYAEALFIPNCTPNPTATAIVLENLMYESEKTVFPEYLEQVVQLQRVRNAESHRIMTEIIWNTDRFISMLDIYGWGGMAGEINSYANNGQSITTLGQSLSRSMKMLIERSIGAKQEP